MVVQTFPLVSVLMPAYNVEPYVEQSVRSILHQSYTHFELIIADDCSTDGTVKKLSAFSDPRIKRINHPCNIGYVANMNALMKAASGALIVIQDADDWSAPGRLEEQVRFLSAHKEVDVVGCAYVKVTGQELEAVPVPTGSARIQEEFEAMSYPLPVLNGTVMFRRSIVDEGYLYRDLRYVSRAQDDDWLFRISEAFSMDNIPSPLYYYRYNPSSMTSNPDLISYKSLVASDFVRHLKRQRMEKGKDALSSDDREDAQAFFQRKQQEMTAGQPAYLQLYIAHKWLGMGKKKTALKWLTKALFKDPWNGYIWKKMVYVMFNAKF